MGKSLLTYNSWRLGNMSFTITKLNEIYDLVQGGDFSPAAVQAALTNKAGAGAPPPPPPSVGGASVSGGFAPPPPPAGPEEMIRKLAVIHTALAAHPELDRAVIQGFVAGMMLKGGKLDGNTSEEKVQEITPVVATVVAGMLDANATDGLLAFKKWVDRFKQNHNGLIEVEQNAREQLQQVLDARRQRELLENPVLAAELERLSQARDEFIQLHIELEQEGLAPEAIASDPRYIRMVAIIQERDTVKAKLDASKRTLKPFEAYLNVENNRITQELDQLAKTVSDGEARIVELTSQIEKAQSTSNVAVAEASKAYRELTAQKVEAAKARTVEIQAQEAAKEQQDMLSLVAKINRFWSQKPTRFGKREVGVEQRSTVLDFMAAGKTPAEMLRLAKEQKVKDKMDSSASVAAATVKSDDADAGMTPAQQEWIDLFIEAQLDLNGLSGAERARARQGFQKQDELFAQLKVINARVAELLAQHSDKTPTEQNVILQRELGDENYSIFRRMAIKKYSSMSSMPGSDRMIPEIKSQRFLQEKVDVLRGEVAEQQVLADAFVADAAEIQRRYSAGSSSESSPAKLNFGLTPRGNLEIKLIQEREERVAKIEREKAYKTGLIVKIGNRNIFIVSDEYKDLPEGTVQVNDTPVSLMTESAAEQAILEFMSDGGEGMKTVVHKLDFEALTDAQLTNLANYLGPDFALNFDVKDAASREALVDKYDEFMRKSSLTMGDIMLVALGYRYRSAGTLMDIFAAKEDGFYFDTDHVTKADEFFADEVTLAQAEEYRGEKKDPIRMNATTRLGTEFGSAKARSVEEEHAGFPAHVAQLLGDKPGAIEEMLAALFEEANRDEEDAQFVANRGRFEMVMGRIKALRHPQERLAEFLSRDPNVYSEEGKRILAECYADAVRTNFEVELIAKELDKLMQDIPKDIEAKQRAKALAANAERDAEERARRLAEMREQIKVVFLGDKDAVETEDQTMMLDRLAELLLNSENPDLRRAADARVNHAIAQSEQQIGAREQRMQAIGASSKPADVEEMARLRREIENLRREREDLNRTLEALREMQRHAEREAARPKESPEQVLQRTHDVAQMYQAAAELQMELDLPTVLAWARNAARNRVEVGALTSEATSKFSNYKPKK